MAAEDPETLEPIRKVVRICELLGDPQNHILVKGGQLIKKQIYTRTASDMKAEMAQELASLSRYTAWVKKVDDSNLIVKNKIRTFSVAERFEYNTDYMKILQRFIKETRELYCTRRDLIEEEIIKRQARWRGGAQSPPAEQAASQEVAGSSSKPKPPPSSISHQPAVRTQEPVKPNIADIPEEPEEEKNLIYCSNFYLPDDGQGWEEGETAYRRCFRQDGYFHVELNRSDYTVSNLIKIPITDFRVQVDIAFKTGSKGGAVFGVLFKNSSDKEQESWYLFSISPTSKYALFMYANHQWRALLDYRFSEVIRGDYNLNSLMMEIVGEKITLGINGHILDTVIDNTLTSGFVGIGVSKTYNDAFAGVKFRNFRIYSLER